MYMLPLGGVTAVRVGILR